MATLAANHAGSGVEWGSLTTLTTPGLSSTEVAVPEQREVSPKRSFLANPGSVSARPGGGVHRDRANQRCRSASSLRCDCALDAITQWDWASGLGVRYQRAVSDPRTPEKWLARAAEARTIAEGMRDPSARAAMLGIAAGYERLATYAVLAAEHSATRDAGRDDQGDCPRAGSVALHMAIGVVST